MEKTILQLIKELTWYNKVEKSKEILNRLISSFIQDAPSDGNTYGRKNGNWEELGGGSGVTPSLDEVLLVGGRSIFKTEGLGETILDGNAKTYFIDNEFVDNIVLPTSLFKNGDSIVIDNPSSTNLFSTVVDEQTGIQVNGITIDDVTPLELLGNHIAILTKLSGEDFAGEFWSLGYLKKEELNITTPGLNEVTTVNGWSTNDIRVSTEENPSRGVRILNDSQINISSSIGSKILLDGRSADPIIHFIGSVGDTPTNFFLGASVTTGGGYTITLRPPGDKLGEQIIATLNHLPQVSQDYANDATAALNGISVGGMYHTAGVVKIRLS